MSAIDPHHDLVHEPDATRERWRESYYFAFYDFRHGIGGFSTIGYRPAKRHSGALNVIWGLDLPTLVASEYDSYDAHDAVHPVAGLAYIPSDPFGRWSLRFDGQLNDGGRDVACELSAVAAVARSERPSVEVSYELDFIPDQPAYMYAENPAWDGLFDGHVDEVGRVSGRLRIAGRDYEIDGRGAKDHSWGARDWSRPQGWRWVDLLAEEGPELTLWRSTFDGTEWLQDGATYAAGAAEPILAFDESVAFASRPRADRPATWDVSFRSDSHVVRGHAEILRVVPLLFPMRDEHGTRQTAWIDKTTYRCELSDGRTAVGSAEFMFRAPEAGPAPRPLVAS